MSLTDPERKIITSALGLSYAKKPYRNHYLAPATGHVRDLVDTMANAGLMERGHRQESGMRFFYVTETGAAAVGHKLPED